MLTPLQIIKNEFLEIQSILRFFDQERNRLMYQNLDGEQRAKVDEMITAKNFVGIKILLNDQLNLSQRNIGYLRTLAQSLGVFKYSTLSRRDLVDAIVAYRKIKNDQADKDPDQDSPDRVCIRPE